MDASGINVINATKSQKAIKNIGCLKLREMSKETEKMPDYLKNRDL
jgi:hypothetical protein